MVLAEASQGWDDPRTLVPLIVSLVALLGVVLTNVVTSINTARAEDRRARSAIAAEDARAAAAIAAEDRRHEHALTQAQSSWVRDRQASAYVDLIALCESVLDIARRDLTHDEQMRADRAALAALDGPMRRARFAVLTVGNPRVAELAGRMYVGAQAYLGVISKPPPGSPGDAVRLFASLDQVTNSYNELVDVVRTDFGLDPVLGPDPDEQA